MKNIKRNRESRQYIAWRKAVRERDNYLCMNPKCTNQFMYIDKEFVAHHLLKRKSFPEHKFNVDNGITLCPVCHYMVHADYGFERKFNEDIDYESKVERVKGVK